MGPVGSKIGSVAAIVGVGETAYSRRASVYYDDTYFACLAGATALRDAGLRPNEVDGLIVPYMGPTAEDLISNLGLSSARYVLQINLGGASAVAALRYAAVGIAAGLCEYVLIPVGWAGYSGTRARSLAGVDARTAYRKAVRDLYGPYGANSPIQLYAHLARRHMEEFNTTAEALGAIAIGTRRNALLRGSALIKEEVEFSDYLASPYIVEPLRKLDCCLETDGGAAVVVASAEFAKGSRQGNSPILVSGVADARPSEGLDLFNREDFLETGLRFCAPEAFEMAGIAPAEAQLAEFYDATTFEVIQQLEEAGICRVGEGGEYVLSGAIGFGGRLPVNTDGGLLSKGHGLGMGHIVEAVTQLRHHGGATQVKDAKVGLVTGFGDLGDASIAILRRLG